MANDTVAPAAGAVASFLLAVAVFAPAMLISTESTVVADYYASGAVGVSVVGFLALLSVVVFLAGAQDRTAPATVAGLTLVLGLAMLALSLLWALSVDRTLLFSFPPQYTWIEDHRWVVVALAAAVPVAAAVYARDVLA